MTRSVSRWPLTAEAWVRSQVSRSEIFGGQSYTRTGFSPSALGFHCQYNSTNGTHSSSGACSCYQKEKLAKPWNLPKISAVLEIGEHQIENTVTLLFLKF